MGDGANYPESGWFVIINSLSTKLFSTEWLFTHCNQGAFSFITLDSCLRYIPIDEAWFL